MVLLPPTELKAPEDSGLSPVPLPSLSPQRAWLTVGAWVPSALPEEPRSPRLCEMVSSVPRDAPPGTPCGRGPVQQAGEAESWGTVALLRNVLSKTSQICSSLERSRFSLPREEDGCLVTTSTAEHSVLCSEPPAAVRTGSWVCRDPWHSRSGCLLCRRHPLSLQAEAPRVLSGGHLSPSPQVQVGLS